MSSHLAIVSQSAEYRYAHTYIPEYRYAHTYIPKYRYAHTYIPKHQKWPSNIF
jgi:hypothetical protein